MKKYALIICLLFISSISYADRFRTDCINRILAGAGVVSGTEYKPDLDTLILYENYPDGSGGTVKVQSVYTTSGAISDNVCIPKSQNPEREISVQMERLFIRGYSQKSTVERENYLNSLLHPCGKTSMNRLKTVLNRLRSDPDDQSVINEAIQ